MLQVVERQQITPRLVRIVAGGEGFAQFRDNDYTDKYAKLLFAAPGSGLRPPYDLAALRAESPDLLPVRRTYTIRWVDHAEAALAIDFVVHGDDGIAAPWAVAAQPGETLVLTGAGGGYAPEPDADWHLLVGDHSAVPAIAQALEALPPHATGHVLLYVEHDEDRVDLGRPDGVDLSWVEPGDDDDALVAATTQLVWPAGMPHAFVHGERGTVKRLRRHLVDERALPRDRMSISAYWARGRGEDEFQAEKREPIGQI